MRCNNCGWDNPTNIHQCEKCKSPIQGSSIKQESDNHGHSGSNLDKTLKGATPVLPYIDIPSEMPKKENDNADVFCSNCGYPNPYGSKNCIQCKTALKLEVIENNKKDFSKTQTPWGQKTKNKFVLRELLEDNTYGNSIDFNSENTILNRSNTIPSNTTITSKEQAQIELKDGKWFIEDKSSLKTTFVRISQPIEIKKGDIIMLGDARFEFDI